MQNNFLNFLTFLGVVLILVAVLRGLRFLSVIDPAVFSAVVSWQSLLVVLGFYGLITGSILGGGLLTLTGVYFLLPHLARLFAFELPWDVHTIRQLYFTSMLLFAGITILVFGARLIDRAVSKARQAIVSTVDNGQWQSDSGVVQLKSVFTGVEHEVIGKPFRGANIINSFAGTVLDLRNTDLKQGETFVDVKCVFGGVNIIVPAGWHVTSFTTSVFGATVDKRDMALRSPMGDKTLVIRGEVIFGGVEIRNSKTYDTSDFSYSQTYGTSKMEDQPKANTADTTACPDEDELIDSISVKINNRVHIINVEDLNYIQADGDYVTLCTAEGKYLKEQTMKYFETALPADSFVRIHRSYIVNMAQISCLETRGRGVYYVILKDSTALRTSTAGHQLLKSKLSL